MTPLDHKKYFSHFLKNHEGKLHFAAHSHHFWPDVTRDAQLKYWDDSARLSDHKWGHVFQHIIPRAQKHISQILNLKHPEQIVFAPNTHEFVARILSLFLGQKKINILTTSSEFHSWRRQITRLMELPDFNVNMVSTEIKSELIKNLKEELKTKPDLFFLSQVFFDSGMALTDQELLDLKDSCDQKTIMVIDGYHGFAALPCDLSQLEGQVFYLGGGYKYAQAGEGVGFMVVPKGEWRPAYTGWFADYGHLTKKPGKDVGYSSDGLAFMGATQDPSGLYRFNASWDLFEAEGLTTKVIHDYVRGLQLEFLSKMPDSFLKGQKLSPLFTRDLSWHGHFLTFESSSEKEAEMTEKNLQEIGVFIDRRSKRLRIGFGLYQNKADVHDLCHRLEKLPTL